MKNIVNFHAPKDKKGMSVEEFNRLIREKIDNKDFFFEGYIFPGALFFRKVEFLGDANFHAAQFSGEQADFGFITLSGELVFIDIKFDENCRFTLSAPTI